MKTLQKLLASPFAIAFAVLHWIIFLPALWNSNMHDGNWQLLLSMIIIVIDLPAILPAALLSLPLYLLGEDNFAWRAMLLASFLTITFQWLFIGKFFSDILKSKKSRATPPSLKDE
jgi:hypothetical protein